MLPGQRGAVDACRWGGTSAGQAGQAGQASMETQWAALQNTYHWPGRLKSREHG